MMILSTLRELLEHIKEVQEDTIKLSLESTMMLGKFIENSKVELDDNAATALQYQDIISQQLSATIEAMNSVEQSIRVFENSYQSDDIVVTSSLEKLQKKLELTLEDAKKKRDAFSGKLTHKEEDEIEFF
ncbi:MAG: hypothetical protein L3I99_00110 [Sulfurimonas sp.]|nr:hypothetical protein [Sulfurimonas sp.]